MEDDRPCEGEGFIQCVHAGVYTVCTSWGLYSVYMLSLAAGDGVKQDRVMNRGTAMHSHEQTDSHAQS